MAAAVSRRFLATSAKRALEAEPFGVYVHWPYCSSLCTYCNFNKYLDRSGTDTMRLQQAYVLELNRVLADVEFAYSRPVRSIYFGGGTPSLAPSSVIGAIIDAVKNQCQTTPMLEVTLEANPTSLERERLRDFRDAGVTRLSLGIQALNDDDLIILGRKHTAKESILAVETAMSVFPSKVSLDLIWGRPHQTEQQWRQELKEAMMISRGHLSLYHLALEKGTKLERQYRANPAIFPNEKLIENLFMATIEETSINGYRQYEASSFAWPGHESIHNSAYWKGFDYIGLGPGAHGRFFSKSKQLRERRIQILQPELWMSDLENGGNGTKKTDHLTSQQLAEELIMLGMQLRDGIDAKRFSLYTNGMNLFEFINITAAKRLVADAFLEMDEQGIRPTSSGICVVDSLLPQLLRS